MSSIVFPHVARSEFPYRKTLEWLETNFPPFVYASEREDADDDAGGSNWPERPAFAVVTHPYWLEAAASLRPEKLLVLLPERTFEENSPIWNQRLAAAAGLADAFAAASETRYLAQTFKNRATLLIRSSGDRQDDDSEEPLLQVLRGRPVADVASEQRGALARHYAGMREKTGPHETVSFLLSVYEYLTGGADAELHLLEAFAHAVELRRDDCLITHYRFVSAILVGQGDMEGGLSAFGISAVTEGGGSRYAEMLRLFGLGREKLAKAQLLRYNDDLAAAFDLLEEDDSPEAFSIRANILLETERREEALELLAKAGGRLSPRDALLLKAGVLRTRGRRREAIGLYLEAAELDRDAIGALAEWKTERQALERLRQGLRERPRETGKNGGEAHGDAPGGDSERPQNVGQQADGDASGTE